MKIFTRTLGWITIYKKCGPIPGRKWLDIEIAGCSMLIESF